jgi:TRAP-type C4-dicarboxylate transport system permease small subunit
MRPLRLLRVTLDALYRSGGVLAALALFGLFVIIVAQMVARWSGVSLRGSTDYAGYLMAASAFLAFATALDRGYHIRVTMLQSSLGRAGARWAEVWAFGVGSVISIYVAWYACKAVWWSRKLGDLSQGLDATPLWIPQITMAAGAILLAIAFLDHFLRVLLTGRHGVGHVSEDVIRSE